MRELRNIVIFAEVANCGSFSQAAKNLGLTPSAISMSIQKLESILGTRLLNRTTRQLQLTPEGAAFLEPAQQGLNKIDEAIDLFDKNRTVLGGALAVSMVTAFGRSVILPILSEFIAENPDIQLDLRFNDQMPDLIKEHLDVGMRYGEPNQISYTGRFLCSPALVLVASPDYLAKKGIPSVPRDLYDHDVINVRMSDGHQWPWKIGPRIDGDHTAVDEDEIVEFPANGKLTVSDHFGGLTDMAKAGLGITMLQATSAIPYLANGDLKIILPDYDVQSTEAGKIYILYPNRKYLPARVRSFIDFLLMVRQRDSWGTIDRGSLRQFAA